jgi:hypothetical protein
MYERRYQQAPRFNPGQLQRLNPLEKEGCTGAAAVGEEQVFWGEEALVDLFPGFLTLSVFKISCNV